MEPVSETSTGLLVQFGVDHNARVRNAIAALKNKKMVILVDDEDRENEGDLIMAAECVEAHHINFMAKEGRGLICVTLTPERLSALDLPLMVEDNSSGYGTAFTVSIEARTGVTTGISAADRARTIQVVVDADSKPNDLVRPGHIFPLRAQPGGVLVRTGQTEGSVDLAKLAGMQPAGVICEILNDDGTMARLPELVDFAEKHELTILSVADLIAFRLEHESLIQFERTADIQSPYGVFEVTSIASTVNDDEAILFKTAAWDDTAIPTVRIQSGDLMSDVFGGILTERQFDVHHILKQLSETPAGALLYIPRKTNVFDFSTHLEKINSMEQLPQKGDAETGASPVMRHYGLGAQILRQAGLRRIRLLSNSQVKLPGRKGFGIEIVETVPFE